MRAARWAVSLVESAPNQGHQMTSLQVATLFDKQLPVFVAPDAK